MKQKAFERAIAADEKAADPLPTFENIKIDDDYKGPQLAEDGEVSRQFMINLEKWFKDQNRLHKRYIYQMVTKGIEIFSKKPTLVEIDIPSDRYIRYLTYLHTFEMYSNQKKENFQNLRG